MLLLCHDADREIAFVYQFRTDTSESTILVRFHFVSYLLYFAFCTVPFRAFGELISSFVMPD